jgi:uncharacterized protein
MKQGSWLPIGTVVGNATTSEFSFILKSFKSRVGDLVAVRIKVPDDARKATLEIFVWGRVISIDRFNPFFPYEAAQELSDEGISLQDTILSNSRDQLEAKVLILGCTPTDADFSKIDPLTYPVQPAAEVLYPPAEAIKELLAGGIAEDTALHIGTLIARKDVDVSISADRIVSRHIAVLAMTGGGKTVAARRILKELIDIGYPLLIIDPHGDYLGLWDKREIFKDTQIKLLYPHLSMTDGNRDIVETLINKMTEGLTEPQREIMGEVIARVDPEDGETVLRYIMRLRLDLGKMLGQPKGKGKGATLSVCRRKLANVESHLERMEQTNLNMRRRLKDLTFEKMADPRGRPEAIVAPNTVSILYLGGYDHLTQTTIVSILLEGLYEHRSSLSRRIPPFLAVVEEAHTFIPSAREAPDDVPSLATIRKLITEGRKFGTGLMLISQRPSRLDETILSQCNSFLILRLVNPRDQSFVKQIMENLSDQDAKMLPGFGPGQGIVSGQAVRFPLLVRVDWDQNLAYSKIGDEKFLQEAREWAPDTHAATRAKVAQDLAELDEVTDRRTPTRPASHAKSAGDTSEEVPNLLSDHERWDRVRVKFESDSRNFAELEVFANLEWDKSQKRTKLSKLCKLPWSKLPSEGIRGKKRLKLLLFLEEVKRRLEY